MKSTKILYTVICILWSFSISAAQSDSLLIAKIDTFNINFENKYELSSVFIIPLSPEVRIGEKLLPGNSYLLDVKTNKISLSDTVTYSIFDTLYINYLTRDLSLQKIYKNRSLVRFYDAQLDQYIGKVNNESVDLSSKAIFGNDLQSSGTLLRGFSFGTNKDLAVTSGLRLQLAGKLSEEIEIVAALTDENTPIQPEGNTERLEELDKVFIEIKHANASAIFGDYNLRQNIGEFGRVDRKLKGVIGNFKVDNYAGGVSFASSRGKFNSMQFNGIDGVQGPYRLLGADNENDIIVIAGSEKVFIDGGELKRGENNEYVIEYANGEIRFTPKVLITSLSRITVDFEYTSRQYERNVINVNTSASFFENKLKLSINAYQEGDNKNNPIDLNLSEKDEERLSQSGDDFLLAAESGVIELTSDSVGIYSSIDTVLAGEQITIYQYAPGSVDAKYNIVFSFIGENKGDYIREGIGKFKFVGIKNGAYLPIRLIPLPEKNQLGNILVEYSPIEKIKLSVELAASSYDKNTYSEIDDNDNNGFASNIKLSINPLDIKLFETELGNISGYYRDRYLDNNFKTIDRINEIEFERNYNTSSILSKEERLKELQLNYKPTQNIDFIGQYGSLKKANGFSSQRIFSKTSWNNYNNFDFNYAYDFVNTNSFVLTSDWLKQNGEISYSIWNAKPGISFRSENKKEKLTSLDSLIGSSQKYLEYSPFLHLSISNGFGVSSKYSFTKEESAQAGFFIEESKSYTNTYSVNWNSMKEFVTELDFSFRKKKYSDYFAQKGLGNNESIIIRSQSSINLFDRFIDGNVYYQAASERTAKFERVFLRVPQGTGAFSYQGDLNNNGVADESEYIPDLFEGDFIQTTLPTDELFPVIDLKINSRWRVEFSKYFTASNWVSTALNSLSSETSFRVEENSRMLDTKKIYLLNFNYFMNDSTTIRGSNYFQQDLHIFKNQRDLSFRFRFTERNSLNQFSAGLEKSYLKERGLKIKFRMIQEVNNETEYTNLVENVNAPKNTNRSRSTNGNELKTDFSYRPYNNLEFGFLLKVGRIEDHYPATPTIIDENKINLRFTLSLLERGRLRFEIERTELLTNTTQNIIPFEITNGNLIGKNYIWRTNFDYRFSTNLQTNINYSGRIQGKGKVINTLRAEARAYF